jgi:hypothetical protein
MTRRLCGDVGLNGADPSRSRRLMIFAQNWTRSRKSELRARSKLATYRMVATSRIAVADVRTMRPAVSDQPWCFTSTPTCRRPSAGP